jgi:hypothetical protein
MLTNLVFSLIKMLDYQTEDWVNAVRAIGWILLLSQTFVGIIVPFAVYTFSSTSIAFDSTAQIQVSLGLTSFIAILYPNLRMASHWLRRQYDRRLEKDVI